MPRLTISFASFFLWIFLNSQLEIECAYVYDVKIDFNCICGASNWEYARVDPYFIFYVGNETRINAVAAETDQSKLKDIEYYQSKVFSNTYKGSFVFPKEKWFNTTLYRSKDLYFTFVVWDKDGGLFGADDRLLTASPVQMYYPFYSVGSQTYSTKNTKNSDFKKILTPVEGEFEQCYIHAKETGCTEGSDSVRRLLSVSNPQDNAK